MSENDKSKAQDRFFVTAFINGADCVDWSLFGKLLDGIQKEYLQDQDVYSKPYEASTISWLIGRQTLRKEMQLGMMGYLSSQPQRLQATTIHVVLQ